MITKYNWKEIQQLHDSGMLLKEICEKYGTYYSTLAKAEESGRFIRRHHKRAYERPSLAQKLQYDWVKIQEFYDAGNSWRDIQREFSIANRSIQKAVRSGRLKTRSLSDAMKIVLVKNGPNRMGQEARETLSREQSARNRGGKCKWFYVSGQAVQGTWEKKFAEKLTEVGITWIKLHTTRDIWPYVVGGKLKNYTPDFYLPELNTFVELKGYWWGDDKEKMTAVLEQHTDRKLVVVEKEQYKRLIGMRNKEELVSSLG